MICYFTNKNCLNMNAGTLYTCNMQVKIIHRNLLDICKSITRSKLENSFKIIERLTKNGIGISVTI